MDFSPHSVEENSDQKPIPTSVKLIKNNATRGATKTITSATEIKPIFKVTKVKNSASVKEPQLKLRHRMTKDEHAVLEAAFDPLKEWNRPKMLELAKRLNISTQKVYKWGFDRRKKLGLKTRD